ncbi:hypothetical protein IQ06DRAFT_356478 [Phaeosphaeriaceae sp. SRC1lsM3a]|nr:hypothetical protein IQ06DRAFT_356478 [Stagonospora sp. SRC1lsM3a]
MAKLCTAATGVPVRAGTMGGRWQHRARIRTPSALANARRPTRQHHFADCLQRLASSRTCYEVLSSLAEVQAHSYERVSPVLLYERGLAVWYHVDGKAATRSILRQWYQATEPSSMLNSLPSKATNLMGTELLFRDGTRRSCWLALSNRLQDKVERDGTESPGLQTVRPRGRS